MARYMFHVCLALCVSVSLAAPLALPRTFLSSGVIQAEDHYYYSAIPCLYLEPAIVTKAPWAWAAQGQCAYLYQSNQTDAAPRSAANFSGYLDVSNVQPQDDATAAASSSFSLSRASLSARSPPAPRAPSSAACNPGPITPQTDRPGDDLDQVVLPETATAADCQAVCCNNSLCMAFFFGVAPSSFGKCTQGVPCCYMKSVVGPTAPSTVDRSASGVVRPPPPPGATPPVGMRSAVPQGGINAGTIELRGDGGLYEWTIVNQSPGGGAKYAVLDDAFFAVKVDSANFAKSLRTHPPAGVEGVESLEYSGAYPVGRLVLNGNQAPAGLSMALYAYSPLHPGDLQQSSLPAIVYTLEVNSSSAERQDVEFLFNLPLALEQDMARAAPFVSASVTSAADCWRLCSSNEICESFTFNASHSCMLALAPALNAYVSNSTSGLPGGWLLDPKQGCATLVRSKGGPARGNASVCAEAGQQISFYQGDTAAEVFANFAAGKSVADAQAKPYSAVGIKFSVAPGLSETASLSLGWYYPDRDHMGQTVGNFYATLWESSVEVAQNALAEAPSMLEDIGKLHDIFFGSSLPDYLQDFYVNSLSHFRSAWWDKSGRNRQWEAYDCVNIDSVHNDGERHIPYITFFPQITESKLDAWGAGQASNGMINEQLGSGCMGAVPDYDRPSGRVMSDVTSMYLLYFVELNKWGNNTAMLEKNWPAIESAIAWQMSTAATVGLPTNIIDTYDILRQLRAMFYLMSMKAGSALATAKGNTSLARDCDEAFDRGQAALDTLLWTNDTFYAMGYQQVQSIMADCMYGQVLAYTAGFGTLVKDPKRLVRHQTMVLAKTDTPFGLQIVYSNETGETYDSIWQMASPNWASINLHLGTNLTGPVNKSMVQPAKSLGLWRTGLHDLWNVAGLASHDGLPYVTSHYGYAMSSWYLVHAYSGQQADLPKGTLSFNPVLSPPYKLPVLLPGVLGTVEAALSGGSTRYTFDLRFGELNLQTLTVGETAYPGHVKVKPGSPAVWS